MSTELIKELENAANIIMAPPNLISNDQRRAAENIFLDFRRSKSPYAMCRQILETSQVGFVLFEAAEAIKRALIREWSFLQESDIIALRQYLIHYITNRDIPPFVQDRLLQVIAIMVKRASVDDFGHERASIINEVENLIVSPTPQKQILGCKIIMNLMQEYANTVKSTDVGLAWEVHFKAKKQFEATDLKRIFKFCVQVLSEICNTDGPYGQDMTNLLKHLLTITERILSWGFISQLLPKRLIGVYETVYEADQAPALRLGVLWKSVMLAPQLLPLMFQLYWKVREYSELSHHALTCLVQLATLNGAVLGNDDEKLQYIVSYMDNFLKLTSSVTIRNQESLGISNIVRKLELFFGSDIAKLPRNIQESYLDDLTRLTCAFAEGAAVEEYESEENKYYMESFDNMLEAWTTVLRDFADEAMDLLLVCGTRIFNTYLQCHLAPPDGKRQPDNQEEVEEIEDNEDNDRIKFRDQLQTIGMFGRNILEHAVPILYRLLEERIVKLRSHFQAMQSHPMTINDASYLDNLFEDIHWIVLIAGHVLCMDSEGETALIPSEVMQFSIKEHNKGLSNLDATLKIMAGIQQMEFDNDSLEKCDKAIRIFCNVLKICFIETSAAEVKLGHFMSPEVGCTVMWFMKRWCLPYVLPVESFYDELSPTLVGALGRDTDGVKFIINFVLRKILANIIHFSSEPILLQDSISLFVDIAGVRLKSTLVLKSEGLWNLVNYQSKLPAGALPQNARRGLFKGFVLAGGSLTEPSQMNSYFEQILKPVEQRFTNFMTRKDLRRVYQEESLRTEIVDILECLVGVARGAQMSTVQCLFDFLSPLLQQLGGTVQHMYCHYQIIVQLILELFGQCAKCMLCYLSQTDSIRLYDSTLTAVQTYAKCNENRFTTESFQEESSFQDLALVLDLLTYILSKDCLDLSSVISNTTTNVTAADISLFGLTFIMPLMTVDLLKYPSLCAQYYRLIVLINDIYPEKIASLTPPLLDKLLVSIEMGLTQFGPDVVQASLDFIQGMATFFYRHPMPEAAMYQKLVKFLNIVLDLTMTQQINCDLNNIASTAIYSLMCCYSDEYHRLVRHYVQSATDPLVAERLAAAFQQLTENVALNCDRLPKLKFRDNFDRFIANVHGFLLTK